MPAIKEILVLQHSHFDLGFTHTQPVLWELQRRFIDQAIELCERTADAPEPSRVKWTCEATAPVLHWLKHSSGRQIERFARFSASGQIAVSAMLCNLTPLYDAEEFARSLYPVRELRERFKLPIRVAMNNDVNGIPWPAAELLLDSGVELLTMGINVHFGGFPLHRPLAFQWRAPDGRRILAFNGEHYGAFDRELRVAQKSTAAMADGLAAYIKRINKDRVYPYDFIYLTATNHGDNSPPNPDLALMVRRWNDEGREPVIRFATPEMLLERLRAQPAAAIPEHSGDWTDFWNFGAASSARETAINRRARRDLCKAEVLRTITGGGGDAAGRRLRDEAWWQVCFYDEHTWGASGSVAAPDEENAAAQWNHKANYAYEARALSGLVLCDQLELLAGNSANTSGVKSVLFTNATPVPVREFVRLQNAFFDGSWRHIAARIEGLSHAEWLNDSNSRIVGPVELPAFGWRVIPIEELIAARAPDGIAISGNTIESPSHRLSFDPSTGRVTSLFDKQQQWEAVDVDSAWPLFGYVQETVDPQKEPSAWPLFQRNALFEHDWKKMFSGESCWRPDWPAVRCGPTKLLSCAAEKSARGVSLVLKLEAPGVDLLEQRITLLAHRPSVEFTANLRKLDVRDAEATYFTFPLNLGKWRAHYDTAGLPAELDAEQLPGVVRDWVTVDRWVSVHDAGRGVTLVCPDAPLVQIGGFNFAKAQAAIPRDEKPLLLAWPTNNYWTTNFKASQPGFLSLRYELVTHAAYDPERSTRAACAATPLDCHPVPAGGSTKARQALEATGAGVVALQVKPPERGEGIIVRLANVGSKPSQAVVKLPGRAIAKAFASTVLEENGAALTLKDGAALVNLAARAIVTVRLVPAAS